MNKNNKTTIQFEGIVFSLLAGFCIASLGCILLFVVVHGIEKKVWEYWYLIDLFIALFFFYLLHSHRLHHRAAYVRRRLIPSSASAQLCLIIVASFVLQYCVISLLTLEPDGDYAVFSSVANDIFQHNHIRLSEYVALFPHILGYSSFLGVLFRFLGRNDITPMINILIGSLITLLLFLILLRRSGLTAAVLISALWFLCPSMLIYSSMVLSEPLYTACILLFLFALSETDLCIYHFTEHKYRSPAEFYLFFVLTFISGLFFGLLLRFIQAVRPVSYVLLIALIIWIIQYRRFLFKDSFSYRCCVLFLFALFLSYFLFGKVWSSYSYHVLHEVPASVPGYNFLTGFNPETSGTHSDMDYQLLLAARDLPGATADSAQRAMLDLLFERLRSGLGFLPRLIAEKLKVFSGSDDSAVLYASSALSSKGQSILAHLCNIYYYSLLLQVAATCIRWVKSRTSHRIAFFAALYILGLSAAHILFLEVNGRYHYSFIPLLLLILGEGYSVSGAPVEKSSQISR